MFASEILSILVQNSEENQFSVVKKGGLELLLVTIADYRNEDPDSEEEKEMIENISDCICNCLMIK